MEFATSVHTVAVLGGAGAGGGDTPLPVKGFPHQTPQMKFLLTAVIGQYVWFYVKSCIFQHMTNKFSGDGLPWKTVVPTGPLEALRTPSVDECVK